MDYFHHVRSEIRPLITPLPHRALDVGCGAGLTLKWLKSFSPNTETVGLEVNSALGEELSRNVDVAVIKSAEDDWDDLGTFDLIMCLDVLEHLTRPEEVLRRLVGMLREGGSVIVSLPNVSHYSVLLPLLLKRQFTYQDSGILDRTHMRLFVESTAVALLNDAGLVVDKGLVNGPQGPKSHLADRISGGIFRHYLTKQYIMRGHKSGAPQGPVSWQPAQLQ